jgi:hypothetical protein
LQRTWTVSFKTSNPISSLTKSEISPRHLCDIDQDPDFDAKNGLYDGFTIVFFYCSKRIPYDLGSNNDGKSVFSLKDTQELIDIVEAVYRAGRGGSGVTIDRKDATQGSGTGEFSSLSAKETCCFKETIHWQNQAERRCTIITTNDAMVALQI